MFYFGEGGGNAKGFNTTLPLQLHTFFWAESVISVPLIEPSSLPHPTDHQAEEAVPQQHRYSSHSPYNY